VAEWIAYHAAIGVDHFIIYDNMSEDGTSDVIARCSVLYPTTIIQWSVQTKFAHQEAYEHCVRSFRLVFDWIVFVDVDEFVLPVRDGTLPAFLATLRDASAVACPWAMFGSSGHDQEPAGLTIDAYTGRAPEEFGPNRHTKMIVRPHLVRQVHLSHYLEMDGWIAAPDGSVQQWESPGLMAHVPDLSICRVNHYFTRSRAQWMRKIERGYRDIVRLSEDFDLYDRNEVQDEVIRQYSGAVRKALDHLGTIPICFSWIDPARGSEAHPKGSPEWHALPPTMTRIPYVPHPAELSVDPAWYGSHNPDVVAAGLGPLEHFWTNGAAENRDPNPYFDTAWYLRTYPDAAQYRRPAFLHFIEVGAASGNRPNGRMPFSHPSN
jgi:hypothetical protein